MPFYLVLRNALYHVFHSAYRRIVLPHHMRDFKWHSSTPFQRLPAYWFGRHAALSSRIRPRSCRPGTTTVQPFSARKRTFRLPSGSERYTKPRRPGNVLRTHRSSWSSIKRPTASDTAVRPTETRDRRSPCRHKEYRIPVRQIALQHRRSTTCRLSRKDGPSRCLRAPPCKTIRSAAVPRSQ